MSVSGGSDELRALVDGARGGREALAASYRAHGVALFRLAYRLTGTREDAEDVLHDGFVRLPKALGSYEERRGPGVGRSTASFLCEPRAVGGPRRGVARITASPYQHGFIPHVLMLTFTRYRASRGGVTLTIGTFAFRSAATSLSPASYSSNSTAEQSSSQTPIRA